MYIDMGTLTVKNFDGLFKLPFTFTAAPDLYLDEGGFTVSFSTGVMAFKLNSKVFKAMLLRVEDAKSDEGGVLPELAP